MSNPNHTTITVECLKCCGHGKIPTFSHVEGGTCFRCGGTGRETVKSSPDNKRSAGPKPLCVGDVDGVRVVCWTFGESIKVEMEDGDDVAVVYCDRAAWRQRRLSVTHGSYGYEADRAAWRCTLKGLRTKLAAA
ncbi:MAG: hypothetical protein KC583_14915 [Myxococcales bacterium]|nr:hypothetical protein [Myxococcales bacterium]